MMNLKLTRDLVRKLAGKQIVHHAAIEDVALAEDGVVDHCVWDPPYDKRTQDNTRRGKKTKHGIGVPMPLGFDPADSAKRAAWAAWAARAARRWVLIFSDHESSVEWAVNLERAGMVYVRSMIWVKTCDHELTHERPRQSATPQQSGDRPGVGHEVIVVAHARGKRMRWNGGGKHGVYTAGVVRGEKRAHPAQKPLALMHEIIKDFCDAGDSIGDAFAGAGTTLVTAKQLAMAAIGFDKDQHWARYAQRRVDAARIPTHGAPE